MNYFWAFVTGGAICVVGQLFLDLTALTPARILTGYVVAGVVLSALGWYAPLAEFAGCGATVPLLGFGHLLAKGVRTALAEEGAIGILTGGLTAAAGSNGFRDRLPAFPLNERIHLTWQSIPAFWHKRTTSSACAATFTRIRK